MKEEKKLKEIYFGFYDQLIEPYCTEAKECWNYNLAKDVATPLNVNMALSYGFDWDNTIGGMDKWSNLYDNIQDYLNPLYLKPKKSYFQEVTEGICELLTEKDKRYGSFIETPLGIFEGKCASGRDIDKKLSRIKNADELRLNDVADTIGYLILAMKEKNWSKQDILNLID
jgi:hypothetical protein